MKHNPVSFFNLYHGTTQESVVEILETKQFSFIQRSTHWLGNGIYFFVDDIDKAMWWSQMTIRRFKKNSEDVGILFVEGYKIKRKKLLNLDSEQDKKKIRQFLKSNKQVFKMNLVSENEYDRKIEARAKLINLMVDYYELSAVKYTFHKDHIKDSIFLEDLGLSNNEVQFCIVDTDTISFNNVRDITQEVI